MLVLRRRTLVIVSLVVLLVVTGYLNFYYNQHMHDTSMIQNSGFINNNSSSAVSSEQNSDIKVEDVPQSAPELEQQAMASTASASTFFIEYRLEREKVRSQEIDTLKEILQNADMDKESKSDAEKTLEQLVKTNETEMAIEGLIKAKGFNDALAFVHETSTNVIVSSQDKLTQAQVAQIQDIVMQKTGQKAENITIIEKK